jgi:hypothetical protein
MFMASGDQLIRQWKIIRMLQSCRYGKSMLDIAAELACNLRTVYRDMDILQSAGFSIICDRHDGKNVWILLNAVELRACKKTSAGGVYGYENQNNRTAQQQSLACIK